MSTPLPDDVRAALDQGRKIDAIRLLRGRTGLGLAEAKAAVEAGVLPSPAPAIPALPTEIPPEAMAMLARGDTIGAIHVIRRAHGIGLKDAKAVADAARRSGAVPRRPGLAPGEVPRRRWPAVLVAVVAAGAALAWFLAGGR